MTARTALPGLMVGALGLVAGVLAVAFSEPLFGIVAGLLALAAGATSVHSAREVETQEVAASLLADELKLARSRAADIDSADDEAATPEIEKPSTEPTSPPTPASTSEPTIVPGDEDEPAVINKMAAEHPTNSALVDQTTGLFSENFFIVALDSRIAAARRHLRPVAMVLLEVVRGLPSEDPSPVDANIVADTVKATLREADTACRLQSGYFALLLEDTPENGAIWTVERIRRQLLEKEQGLTVWAGIACYPAHAFSSERLLEASEQALVAARDWRQDRIEVAVVAE